MSDALVYCLALDGDMIVREAVASNVAQPGMVEVSAEIYEAARNRRDLCKWDGTKLSDYTPPAPPAVAPDGPTLGDWRVGLLLWKTASGNRRDELDQKVADLAATGNVLAEIAKERSQFSNNVFRAQLMVLKDAIGFTEADVDESLYRAHQVSLGDLSGVWPPAT